MEFNSFVFPTLKPTYSVDDFKGELIWVPSKEHFTYRDKLKYTNYKTLIPKTLSKAADLNSKKIKLRHSDRYKTSIIQKVPSISFSFENKFTHDTLKEKETYIPCLFIKSQSINSQKVLLFFHANYEDLGSSSKFASELASNLSLNVLAVEYPGYGVYKSSNGCNSDQILKDSEAIYTFLTEMMNIQEKNIIVMGRCIGSGPATYLASKYKPQSLILLSAFKSIKAAVKSIFDKIKFGWIIEKLVKERFVNSNLLKLVKCPTLFIHGKLDEVIPWQHSLELIKLCTCPAKLVCPENMKHNSLDPKNEILVHLQQFIGLFCEDFLKEGEATDVEEDEDEIINLIYFPLFMYYTPCEL